MECPHLLVECPCHVDESRQPKTVWVRLQDFQEHLEGHPDMRLPFECGYCQQKFDSRGEFASHCILQFHSPVEDTKLKERQKLAAEREEKMLHVIDSVIDLMRQDCPEWRERTGQTRIANSNALVDPRTVQKEEEQKREKEATRGRKKVGPFTGSQRSRKRGHQDRSSSPGSSTGSKPSTSSWSSRKRGRQERSSSPGSSTGSKPSTSSRTSRKRDRQERSSSRARPSTGSKLIRKPWKGRNRSQKSPSHITITSSRSAEESDDDSSDASFSPTPLKKGRASGTSGWWQRRWKAVTGRIQKESQRVSCQLCGASIETLMVLNGRKRPIDVKSKATKCHAHVHLSEMYWQCSACKMLSRYARNIRSHLRNRHSLSTGKPKLIIPEPEHEKIVMAKAKECFPEIYQQ